MLPFYVICELGKTLFLFSFRSRTNKKVRSFDVEKAAEMLDATLKWRKDFDVESICKNWKGTIELENATGKAYVRGHDKCGRAVVVLRPSAENTFDHTGNLHHLVYTMERAVACTKKKGQERISFLIDFDGYSIFNAPSLSTAHDSVRILQDHYPERLQKAYFVRTPVIFLGLFRLVQHLVDSVTLSKACFLSDEDMADPHNQLLVDVDKSLLEACFGGKDHRPFRSHEYLRGGIDEDYLETLIRRKAKARD